VNTYSGSFITTKNSFKIKYYKNINVLISQFINQHLARFGDVDGYSLAVIACGPLVARPFLEVEGSRANVLGRRVHDLRGKFEGFGSEVSREGVVFVLGDFAD